MHVVNDNNCGWINDLNPRTNIKSLSAKEDCDWLIIGAGYTGLSAARKLSQLHPRHRIIITDSQLAGEGALSPESHSDAPQRESLWFRQLSFAGALPD